MQKHHRPDGNEGTIVPAEVARPTAADECRLSGAGKTEEGEYPPAAAASRGSSTRRPAAAPEAVGEGQTPIPGLLMQVLDPQGRQQQQRGWQADGRSVMKRLVAAVPDPSTGVTVAEIETTRTLPQAAGTPTLLRPGVGGLCLLQRRRGLGKTL